MSGRELKFHLDDQEAKALDDFISDQNKKMEDGKLYGGAIGGVTSYKITPTGIGTVITVENTLTGDTVDITNYSNW